MGLALVFLAMMAFFAVVVCICLIGSIVFFIIAFVRKKKEKKYKAFRNIGFACLAPIVFFVIWGMVSATSYENETKNLLSYQLFNGNYSKVEEMLANGASADCSLNSNEEANGEHTIVYALSVPSYYYEKRLEGLVNENNRREFLEFMLECGADPNKVIYLHEKDYEEHSYEGASWKKRSDFCGSTPLIHALRCKDMDTVNLLLEKGADINVIDYCGFNAAAIVVSEFSKDDAKKYLEFLNENGCDMNVMTNYNLTTKELYENRFDDEYPYN